MVMFIAVVCIRSVMCYITLVPFLSQLSFPSTLIHVPCDIIIGSGGVLTDIKVWTYYQCISG